MTELLEIALAVCNETPDVASTIEDRLTAGLESQVATGTQWTKVDIRQNKQGKGMPGTPRVTRKKGSHKFSLDAHRTLRTW